MFAYLQLFDAFGLRAAGLTQVEHERVGTAVGVGHLEPHVRVADRDQGASIGRPRYVLYRPGRLAGVRHDRDRPERRGQRPHLLTARIGEVRLVHVDRIILVDQMLGQLRTVVRIDHDIDNHAWKLEKFRKKRDFSRRLVVNRKFQYIGNIRNSAENHIKTNVFEKKKK